MPILKRVFWNSSNTVKISILNAISILGSKRDIAFLKEVAKKESSVIVVGKAQSTVNAISPETILPSKDIIAMEVEENLPEKDISGNMEDTNVVEEQAESVFPDSIEVEDIEIFDEIERPEPKTAAPINEPSTPAFELNSVEEEYGDSMDQFLGLVSSTSEDSDSTDIQETYDKIGYSEKSKLVGKLTDNSDEQELPLLEHIAENETDSELRFHAFKKIQSIHEEAKVVSDDPPSDVLDLPPEQLSVFYPLYHYTDEIDAKLLLLEELMAVGDKRDVPFLESLLHEEQKIIVKKAEKAIATLSTCEEDTEIQQDSARVHQVNDDSIENADIEQIQFLEKDDRIPMELFLLYEELGIEPSDQEEKKSSPFDFEISEEFFMAINNNDLTNQKEVNE